MDEVEREKNAPYLVLDGAGLQPPPNTEPWKEDVTDAAIKTLNKYMPDVEVSPSDFITCYRVARGKKIMCKFTRYGNNSVRDQIYEGRVKLARTPDGRPREQSEALYVNEVLSHDLYEVVKQLRDARKNRIIYSVFTVYGHIYVKPSQFGAKRRVRSRQELDQVLRGEW